MACLPALSALRMAQAGEINQPVLNGLASPIRLQADPSPPPALFKVQGIAQAAIDTVLGLCQRHLAIENALPGPSSYAQHNTWAEWQKKETAILCFRPNGTQGLPLCVLDDVFRNFQQLATAPLPSTPAAAQAMNAAFNLCRTMPNHFKVADERSKAFDECLVPIFRLNWWRAKVYMQTSTELHTGQVDRTYEEDGMIYILREDKLEMDTGDPYIQVARDYQLYAEKVRNENPNLAKQGVPVFLLCLLGPILLICGGFHDGKSTIVEPLAEPCLLFDDFLHCRQEVLARQLFALEEGVAALRNRSLVVDVNDHAAGVPRVYTTYLAYDDNTERELKWLISLAASHPRSLLIVATEDQQATDPKALRLVKLVSKYGDEVHQLLAEHGFAPKLYGHKSLEGAPTAYVMEYLCPPTGAKPGWITLWQFFTSNGSKIQYSGAIEKTLNDILAVMAAARVVHGDLRPNNIMLEVDSNGAPVDKEGVNLKVVDFDWAGNSGDVHYPLQRNEDITWPASPWTSIVVAHDRTLVEGWWRQQFTLEFRRM